VSEPKSIRLRDRDVAYLLKRSQQRRSIMLSVDERGLTVNAPWRSSERRIGEFASRLDVPAPRLFLSSARTRWGSCNAKREVRLNWRLIQAAQPTIDYVVVHELAHLIEMNHSRRFWKLVASVCPHYRKACAELNRMGLYYMDI
jgi:predicted metal-dependent hydrolase